MKIYLAARYSRREELLRYAKDLEADGHTVTSRWLKGNHQIDDQGLSAEAKAEERTRFAIEDFEDLLEADALIAFTEPPRSTKSRGGRHVEFGIALGMDKRVAVVGPRENVFYCLPGVDVYSSWEAFVEHGFRDSDRTCRVCGYTDQDESPDGRWWIEPDLCANCAVIREEAMP